MRFSSAAALFGGARAAFITPAVPPFYSGAGLLRSPRSHAQLRRLCTAADDAGGAGLGPEEKEEVVNFFSAPIFKPVDAAEGGDREGKPLLETEARHIQVLDNFLPEDEARDLRQTFQDRFRDPRAGSADRFAWDWWHVDGGQYTLLRTPAQQFFGEEAFTKLVDQLTSYGQEALGCDAISPPWLSIYIDGCEQKFHTDAWHGPWAYVLSLTDWDTREFRGGETVILKPHILDYWRTFVPGVGLEEKAFLESVEPLFNRLSVFDPRLPHGVRRVEGTRDPLRARLVLHGWFTDPQPFFTGGLAAATSAGTGAGAGAEAASKVLDEALNGVFPALQGVGRVTGVLTVRLRVCGESGSVLEVRSLTDTLVPDPNDCAGLGEDGQPLEDPRADVAAVIHNALKEACFPAEAGGEDTWITVPFVFE